MSATTRAHPAEQRYRDGRAHAARQEWARARRCLRDAAAQGHAEAMTELALFALFGIGMPIDYQAALAGLAEAERAGSGEAAHQLALMSFGGALVPYDPERVASRVRFAAERDFAPALRAMALAYRHRGGAEMSALADRCLARAAALGDAVSAELAALAAVGFDLTRRDETAAEAARLRAAAPAARFELPPADFAARHVPVATRLHDDPLIETYDGVYSREECAYVVLLGEPHLLRSVTIDDGGRSLLTSDHRKSSDHSFVTFQEDLALRWLQVRMLALIAAPLANCEHLVLLRYQPGEEYRPHRDYLPPSAPGNSRRPDQPGQRLHTTFSYLADVPQGGATEFPGLGVRIAPAAGRVVHFLNLRADGSPDERTWHAGLPVEAGVKYLATLWVRERAYRAW